MDKETLSNYGWIVIAVLVLAIMIALATPFGRFVSDAAKSTLFGFISTEQKALNEIGITELKNPQLGCDTLRWDGDTNDLTSISLGSGIACYKISDIPETEIKENNLNNSVVLIDEGGRKWKYDSLNSYEFVSSFDDGNILIIGEYVIIVFKNNAQFNDIVFQESGIYFVKSESMRAEYIQIDSYDGFYHTKECNHTNEVKKFEDNNVYNDTAPTNTNQSLNHYTTIPSGGKYTTATGQILEEGQIFPTITKGDTYEYGDYIYTYGQEWYTNGPSTGWAVQCTKNIAEPGAILESINGKTIMNMDSTFANLDKLRVSPEIPDTVVVMNATYACSGLTEVPQLPSNVVYLNDTFGFTQICEISMVIPSSVKEMSQTFYRNDGYENYLYGTLEINANPVTYDYCLAGNCVTDLKITGSSNLIDEIGLTGNGYCVEHHGACPSLSIGDTYETTDYIYTYSSSGWRVTAKDQSKESYEDILESIYHISVTDMSNTFKDCTNMIESPKMPNSVETMYGTFANCTSLITVTNLSTKAYDMRYAFDGCISLKNIPDIENWSANLSYTFRNCTALEVAPMIPENLVSCSYAFYNCTSLKTVHLVGKTDNYECAFYNCTSLTGSIRIGTISLWNCTNCFKNVDFRKQNLTLINTTTNEKYMDNIGNTGINYCTKHNGCCDELIDGEEYSTNDYIYIYSSSLNGWKVTVKDTAKTTYEDILDTIYNKNVISIADTFKDCTSLIKAPKLSQHITNMSYAFYNCQSLKNAPDIPDTVTNMYYAFYNCNSMESIQKIPSNVTNIYYAFYKCTSLTGTITIDATSLSKYDYCFMFVSFRKQHLNLDGVSDKLDNLGPTGYDYCKTHNGWCDELFNGDTYKTDEYTYTYNSSLNGWSVKVNDTTKTEYGNILEEISGKKVVSMNDTFSYCSKMTKAPTIPKTVTNLSYAFSGCKSLTTAPTIPSGVTTLSSAFSNCSSLVTAPEIPYGVTNMSGTFSGCTSLVVAPTIPNSVTNMDSTFYKCSSLTTVNSLSSNVTTLRSAFYECKKLTTICEIPESVTNVVYTFYYCSSLKTAPKLPSNITSLSNTFMYCTFTEAPEIPNKVTDLQYTFAYCTKITKAPTIPNGVTNMNGAFAGCTSLTQAPVIPDGVQTMGGTFENCKKITTAPVIPSSVTYLYGTFEGCTGLTGTIQINAQGLTSKYSCIDTFAGVDFKLQKITLTGTSEMIDTLGLTGTNYCETDNGWCETH